MAKALSERIPVNVLTLFERAVRGNHSKTELEALSEREQRIMLELTALWLLNAIDYASDNLDNHSGEERAT